MIVLYFNGRQIIARFNSEKEEQEFFERLQSFLLPEEKHSSLCG